MNTHDSNASDTIIANPWQALRRFTAARIALGRAGTSLPTAAQLDFQLAHALARDAVHTALDAEALEACLQGAGLETIKVRSAAPDRNVYLQRPDLGRRLSEDSCHALDARVARDAPRPRRDLAFVLADGLSARAVQAHAAALVSATMDLLRGQDWHIGPAAVAHQGRVAIGDEIGARLGAAIVAVLIGERPGLSSPDSLGVYLTHSPRTGCVDSMRNCISNIRPEGLSIPLAAQKLHYLLTESRRRQVSGVALKDESAVERSIGSRTSNFLTAE
ncbi:ethanolamine ammonia-lyase subunit EutC [Azoarcus sp. L1K30]|uniref:ethanolamine ammonia-lyase subunit EutC n=1 Tax=Azoarcus sp. L1K30 TaxID=2820277 RepID=UPI001B82F4C2|nr:ethanolamine ammonia-lyase subunit EutC [Azoarcus sp. L1K30]MBR0566659.1 ethanolamine ammonia-lyase subunit EutC [Azoarcus sp. L1K30]